MQQWLVTLPLLAIACGEPLLEGNGRRSLAPFPSGVLEGTVLYVGPRPACSAGRILGRVVLTLFEYDNPPPPSGSATSALNLLIVPGSDLFYGTDDCMPSAPSDGDLQQVITRSAPFVWPEIPLDGEAGVDYQVRGFYDSDEDFIPFFSVRNQPTRGDLAGGAVISASDPRFQRISYGSRIEHPTGQIVSGVVVTLAAQVDTERPLFVLGETTTALSADAVLPATADPVQLFSELWALTQTELHLVSATNAAFEAALSAAGVRHSFDSLDYAWYVRSSVDADADGTPDLHPVFAANGMAWHSPVVILKRAGTPAEIQAGVPDVSIVAAVDPLQTAVANVLSPSLRIVVPPVAVIDLDPTDRACRVPVLAPNNPPSMYAGATDCQRLPTGRYDINVLHGIAGGIPARDGAAPGESETGHTILGGSFAGQAWSIPNELGPADTLYEPGSGPQLPVDLLLESQGPSARFAVIDPSSTDAVRDGCAAPPEPVPAACCAAVTHLCGLPLCAARADEDGFVIRRLEELGDGGVAACVPFEMPASCCP
jgi:hypothetical protein